MKHSEKYVVLEHLTLPDRGLRFFTTNSKDNTHGRTGELWYKEILFTDITEEAQDACREINNTPSCSELEKYYRELYANKNK